MTPLVAAQVTGLPGVIAPAAVAALVIGAAARGTWSPCGLSMVSAINPLSEAARGHRYWATVLWFVTGAVAGGLVLGGIGAAGAAASSMLGLPSAVLAGVAALCCLLALAGDAPHIGLRVPGIPRQVNERWLGTHRRFAYALGFGGQIGFGLATYVMTSAVYLVPVLGVLSGDPLTALACGALFGLVRGSAILLTSAVRSPDQLLRVHRRLAALEPVSMRVVMTLEILTAVVLAVAAAGVVAGAAVLLVAALLQFGVPLIRGRSRQQRAAPWTGPQQMTAAGRLPATGRSAGERRGEAHASTHSNHRVERGPAGRVGQSDPGQLRTG